MNNFTFENGTKCLFGGGCGKEYLVSFLSGYGLCRVGHDTGSVRLPECFLQRGYLE